MTKIEIGQQYEFYAEMQQASAPVAERMRNYTGKMVTVVDGPLPKNPEQSDMYRVRTADGREFVAHEEELNGWDKALGQYFWPDGTYGPHHVRTFLCNEKGQ